jgi:hypothetical protein
VSKETQPWTRWTRYKQLTFPEEIQQNDDSLPNLVPLLCKHPYRSLSFSSPITLSIRSLQVF